MNNRVRKELDGIINDLSIVTDVVEQFETRKSTLSECLSNLECIKDDEECKLDNMPENLRYSMKGDEQEECVEALEDAVCELEEASEIFDEAEDEELSDEQNEEINDSVTRAIDKIEEAQ